MTDLETTFMRAAFTEVLPDLPEVTKDILEESPQSLGVEAYNGIWNWRGNNCWTTSILLVWKRTKKILQAGTKCEVMREQLSGCSQDVTQMLLLFLSYFNSKEDAMFHYVEDTILAEEVEMDKVNLTPTLVVCGKLIFIFSILGLTVSMPFLIFGNNLQ